MQHINPAPSHAVAEQCNIMRYPNYPLRCATHCCSNLCGSAGPMGPQGEPGATGATGIAASNCAQPSYTFVANGSEITVIDPVTHATEILQAPLEPITMAADPYRRKLYLLAATGELAVLDEFNRTFTLLESVPGATTIAVNPNNHKIYVAVTVANLVVVFNGYTDTRLGEIVVEAPRDMVMNTSNNLLYVAAANGLAVINTNIDQLAGALDTPDMLTTLAIDHCANKLFAAAAGNTLLMISTKCHEICGAVPLLDGGSRIAADPALSLLYVVSANGYVVHVYDSCNLDSVGELALPLGTTINGVSIDAVNHLLYFTQAAGAGELLVFDSGMNTAAGSVPNTHNTGGIVTMACRPPCPSNSCACRGAFTWLTLPNEPPPPQITIYPKNGSIAPGSCLPITAIVRDGNADHVQWKILGQHDYGTQLCPTQGAFTALMVSPLEDANVITVQANLQGVACHNVSVIVQRVLA